MSEKLVTPEARLSFPALFEPTRVDESQEPKYGCTLIFPLNADLSQMKAAVIEAAKDEWGDKAIEWFKQKKIRSPFRDQKEKEGMQGYSEGFFIVCRSKQKPGVVNSALQPVIDPNEVFSGLLVRASVKAFAYDHPQGGKGVSFALHNVMIVKDDGTRFDGRTAPEQDFAQYAQAPSASPTAASKEALDII